MKKLTTTVVVICMAASAVFAQQHEKNTKPANKVKTSAEEQHVSHSAQKNNTNKAEAVIFSEDFSSGIPAGWTNVGHDEFGTVLPAALWEYRGTGTTPNVSVGSRGAFDVGTPITAPTANTGFVIFDSDYLDNNGNATGAGTGAAPAPHTGELTTPTIDLTGHPNVELRFNSYHRYFEGRALILLSTDGGTTWPDTIAAHPGIAVNAATDLDAVVAVNVSDQIGNESNVRVQFYFDGLFDDPAATGDGGYYFWMIDDIVIEDLPKHELRFTDWSGAPSFDMIFGPASGSSKMGILCTNPGTNQLRNMEFDANAYNYGYAEQTNVKLKVDILDDNDMLISTYTSTGDTALFTNDTATYNVLNTYGNPYIPTTTGNYKAIYYATSDSTTAVSDTFFFYVLDTIMSIDHNDFTNRVGTPNISDDGSSIASRIDLVEPAVLRSVRVMLSTSTVAGGQVEVSVYDTTGFDYTAGFPANNLVATSQTYTITAADINRRYFQVPVSDGSNPYVELTGDSYFINVTMFSNAGNNPIYIRNGQNITQPSFSSIMYNSDDGRWYAGFTNSMTLNAPHIRANMSVYGVGVNEEALKNSIKLGPNPTTGLVNVQFTELQEELFINVIDITGREIQNYTVHPGNVEQFQIDLSSASSGIYFIKVATKSAQTAFKIVKQE